MVTDTGEEKKYFWYFSKRLDENCCVYKKKD